MTNVVRNVERELRWAQEIGALPAGCYLVETTPVGIEVVIRSIPGRLMEMTEDGTRYTELAKRVLAVTKALAEPHTDSVCYLSVKFSLTRLGSELNRMREELLTK